MSTQKIYGPKIFQLCDNCLNLYSNNVDTDVDIDIYKCINNCNLCKNKLIFDADVSEVFYIMRQWKPNIQKNMHFFINLLFDKNCEINSRDGCTDMTPLMYACRSGAAYIGDDENAMKIVRQLIDKGADLNVKSNWLSMNCIHICAFFDCYHCMKLMLQENFCAGINAECELFNNATPLHIACMNKCITSAHVLLKFGANMNLCDSLGRKPFEYIVNNKEETTNKTTKSEQVETIFSDKIKNDFMIQTLSKIDDETSILLNNLNLKINDRVIVSNKKIGTLRYCGTTKFATGIWLGVELDKPHGKHDGSLCGYRYFQCNKNHGIFCQIDKLKKIHMNSNISHTPKYFHAKEMDLLSKTDSEFKVKRSNSHSMQLNRDSKINKPIKIFNKSEKALVSNSTLSPLFQNDLKQFKDKHKSASSLDANFETEFIEIGSKVMYQGHRAIVRYVGETHFNNGIWVGLEMVSQNGKNDGSIQGIQYFTCDKKKGLFVRPNRLIVLSSSQIKNIP